MENDALTFGCGTTVRIDSMLIRRSYHGLLEGRITDELNKIIVQSHIDCARRVFYSEAPHIIEPDLIADESGKRLPGYCCMVELTSFEPARDPSRMCSGLVLVWFQEDEPAVIGKYARSAAQQLRWADVAIDGDW